MSSLRDEIAALREQNIKQEQQEYDMFKTYRCDGLTRMVKNDFAKNLHLTSYNIKGWYWSLTLTEAAECLTKAGFIAKPAPGNFWRNSRLSISLPPR